MIIKCKALGDQVFESKKSMIDELMKNKTEILAMKKSQMKEADGFNLDITKNISIKSDNKSGILSIGDIVPAVINTTNVLDSHDDVHLDGCWNKSAIEQNGKTYHVVNHDLSLGSVVGYPKDVRVELRKVSWRMLGIDMDGETEALIFHTTITESTNKDAFLAYRDKHPIQHSIRMSYVNLCVAVNDPQYKEEYADWLKYSPLVVNQDAVQERGFFFGIKESKIEKEGSTVLLGSNDITPALESYSITSKKPSIVDTSEKPNGETKTFDVSKAINEVSFF